MLIRPDPDHPLGERVVVMGSYGAGKTYAYWTILSHTDAHFYILDTDLTVPRFLASDRFKAHSDRVTWHAPREWPEYVDCLRKWTAEMGPHDWLVIDNVTKAWSEVQNYFSREVFGEGAADHFLEHRKLIEEAKAKGSKEWANPFDGQTDWQTINKLYDVFVGLYLYAPGHVYLAANAKELHYRERQSQDMQMYQAYGVKPDGQKHLGHACDTVLYLNKPGPGDYRISTVKDREREEMVATPVSDFALTYLLGTGGWQPATGTPTEEGA